MADHRQDEYHWESKHLQPRNCFEVQLAASLLSSQCLQILWDSCRDLQPQQQRHRDAVLHTPPFFFSRQCQSFMTCAPAQCLVPPCWCKLWDLQTTPALGEQHAWRRGSRGSRTCPPAWRPMLKGKATVEAQQGPPGCRDGCQTLTHIIDTVAAKAGRDKYIKLLSAAQLGVSCHQLLQAPLFATQLWHTTQTLTNSHNRSSEANRYYNKQIMIAFILQVGRQWPKWSSPSDMMNQALNYGEKWEAPGLRTVLQSIRPRHLCLHWVNDLQTIVSISKLLKNFALGFPVIDTSWQIPRLILSVLISFRVLMSTCIVSYANGKPYSLIVTHQ